MVGQFDEGSSKFLLKACYRFLYKMLRNTDLGLWHSLYRIEKENFWNWMETNFWPCDMPWFCGGDFNEFLWEYEKSRVKWQHAGDANTTFFHQSTLQKRQQNKIVTIKNGSGERMENHNQIRRNVKDYFKSLFDT